MNALVRNRRTGAVLASNVRLAKNSIDRGIGYLGKKHVRCDEGLLFEQCWAVHTFGMRARIDVIFLDDRKCVLRYVRAAPAQRPLWCPGARSVLELGASKEPRALAVGDALDFECAS